MLKRRFITILLTLSLSVTLAPAAAAAQDISVEINGVRVRFTGQGPALIDGRTLVPVRSVFEALGFEVDWDNETRTAILENENYLILIPIDSYVFTTNGEEFSLDVPAQLINGRTMVPIRLPLESVGFDVDWENNTVIITMPRMDDVVNPIDGFTYVLKYNMSNYFYNPERFGWLLDAGFTVSSNEIYPGIRLLNFTTVPHLPSQMVHSTNIRGTQIGDVVVRGEWMEILIDIGSTIERLREARIDIPDTIDETHRAVHRVGFANWAGNEAGWHQRFLNAFADREYTILPQVYDATLDFSVEWGATFPIQFRHVQLSEPLNNDSLEGLINALSPWRAFWKGGTNTQRGDVILVNYCPVVSTSLIMVDTGYVDNNRPGSRHFRGVSVHHYVWDW